jgi:ATP-dependent DNA ligase
MLSRVRNSRGQAINRARRFHSSVPANRLQAAPTGPGWVHELKHDGYRLQIHVRDGRVRRDNRD